MKLRTATGLSVVISLLGVLALLVTVYVTWNAVRYQQQQLATIYTMQQRMVALSQGINHMLEQRQPAWSAAVLATEVEDLAFYLSVIDHGGRESVRKYLVELGANIDAIAELATESRAELEPPWSGHARTILVNQIRAHESGLNVALQAILADRREAIQAILQRAILALVLVALTLALLTVAGAAVLYRRVNTPLLAFLKAVNALKQGEFPHAVAPGKDEFGDLAQAFNGMVESLRGNEEALLSNQRSLQVALDQQSAILDTLPANVALLDQSGRILQVNSGWREFGFNNNYTGSDIGLNQNYIEICEAATGEDIETARTVADGLRAMLAGRTGQATFTLTYPCHSPEARRWFRLMATPLQGPGQPRGAVVMHVDVTDRKLAEEALSRTAYEEPVTTLLSRAGLIRCMRELATDTAEEQTEYCLLILDVRKLNDINQSCGYVVGDHLLRALGQRLREAMRDDETLAALGGGQFALLFNHGLRGINQPRQVAEWITGLLELPFFVDSHTLYVNVTMGMILYHPGESGHEKVLRQGQLALQTAREQGEPWVLFDPAFEQKVQERIWTTVGLRDALAQRHFELHYQPKVNLADGRIQSAEALLRWRHPILGLRPPDTFIPVAESSQLIIPMGEWVLREACEDLAFWQRQGLHTARIAVNVSMVQFMNSDVVGLVERTLDSVGIDPGALSLEITESVFEQESERLLRQMEALGTLGVHLSLDDFGTGYSSLSHLRHYPFNEIKIDRTFVRDCTESAYSRGIVEMVMSLAATLQCGVVAEGVETAAQRDLLLSLGCQIGQGYFYSMPLAGEDFHWLLRNSSHLPLGSSQPVANTGGNDV